MSMHLAGRLAERRGALGDRCPIDRTMTALGNRTAVLLLREAFYGATRFDDLARRVGVSDAVAAQRLRELVEIGVLRKEPYREPGQRTRHEYLLTPAGHELLPAVLALAAWGMRHLPGGGPTITHRDCGEPIAVGLRCAAGHDVAEDDLVVAG